MLERALLRGAEAAGFPTPLWTCPRVADWIQRRFQIHYHPDHVCRLLHALGFTPQKPARRAIERDEEALGPWVKQQWPTLKKSLAPEGVAGVSGRKRLFDGPSGAAQLGPSG